jgi:hypothetical protein
MTSSSKSVSCASTPPKLSLLPGSSSQNMSPSVTELTDGPTPVVLDDVQVNWQIQFYELLVLCRFSLWFPSILFTVISRVGIPCHPSRHLLPWIKQIIQGTANQLRYMLVVSVIQSTYIYTKYLHQDTIGALELWSVLFSGQGQSRLLLLCIDLCFKRVEMKVRQVGWQGKCCRLLETLVAVSRFCPFPIRLIFRVMLLNR